MVVKLLWILSVVSFVGGLFMFARASSVGMESLGVGYGFSGVVSGAVLAGLAKLVTAAEIYIEKTEGEDIKRFLKK